jgi:hypothetical protein
MPRGIEGAALSIPVAGAAQAAGLDYELTLALVFGVIAVVLARIIWIDRDNRATGRRATVRDTLPLTLVATIVYVALAVDWNLNFQKGVSVGLGVGWTAPLLADIMGDKILAVLAPDRIRRSDPRATGDDARANIDAAAEHLVHQQQDLPPEIDDLAKKLGDIDRQ